METTTFTALCERAGRWWTISVPQLDGLTAQVRSLDQAEIVTRQLIARSLAIPAESVKVDVLHDVPAPVAHALAARHAARQAVEAATQATRDALEALGREGIAFHDAATMLGLSPAEMAHYGPHGTGAAGPVPTAQAPVAQAASQVTGAQPAVTGRPMELAGPLSGRPLSGWIGAIALLRC